MFQRRHTIILEKINRDKMVSVTDLSEEFEVSIETIRRDLKYLEEQGLVKRIYGGAILPDVFNGVEPAYEKREVFNLEEKKAIAKAAMAFIKDGDVIFLDIGTTCLEISKLISDSQLSNLTVITNSLIIAQNLSSNKLVKVYVLGGLLREGDMSLSGFLTGENMKNFRADKAFLGAGGITFSSGITDYNPEEANVRRAMTRNSKLLVVVSDSSKFGVTAMNVVCPLSKVSVLVTDTKIPAEVERQLLKTEIKLVKAE